MTVPERMNFSTSSKGCWGSFSNQKIILQIFDLYTGFKEGFSEKNAIWFSKNEGGGVKGRMEFFQKFIRFGEATRPLQFAVALSQNG